MLKIILSPPTSITIKNLAAYLLNNHFCVYFFYLRYRINHTLANFKGEKKNKTKEDLSFFLTTAECHNKHINP